MHAAHCCRCARLSLALAPPRYSRRRPCSRRALPHLATSAAVARGSLSLSRPLATRAVGRARVVGCAAAGRALRLNAPRRPRALLRSARLSFGSYAWGARLVRPCSRLLPPLRRQIARRSARLSFGSYAWGALLVRPCSRQRGGGMQRAAMVAGWQRPQAYTKQKRGKSGLGAAAVRRGGALRARCTRAGREVGRSGGWCAPRTLYEGGKRCAVGVGEGWRTCADCGRGSAADVRHAAYAPPRLRRCAAPRLVSNP